MHEWARSKASLFLGGLLLTASLFLPTFSYAVGSAADTQCTGTAQCPMGMGPGKDGPCGDPGGGTIGKTCVDVTNLIPTTGICISTIPPKCQAQTTGGKSIDGGLMQLMKSVGQILGKLVQSSGSGNSASTPATGSMCTSYTPTSDSAMVGVNPCVYYVPGSTGTGTGLLSSTSTSAQDLLNSLAGSGGSSNSVSSIDVLNGLPQSGPAPLSVSFETTPVSNDVGPFSIDFGDGSAPQQISQTACTNATPPSCNYQTTYSYASAGTYTANLLDANGNTLASTTISVMNPNGSTSASGTGGPLIQVFNSVGSLFTGTSTQGLNLSGQTSTDFPGVVGNILLNQNGATIFAQTINSANNSETSGFYGSDTMGSQPQGVVSQMCQGRPWASNFLANLISPSFFDSLCQWGGFQVGQTQTQTQASAQLTQPQVILTQQQSTAVRTTKATQTTQAAATSTAPLVPAQAAIWAVPASVPLGTRTSVFWNTQGVTQCVETSPDGSFNGSSFSGAAATVPITEATTYSISCIDPNGNPITNYVTVTISG